MCSKHCKKEIWKRNNINTGGGGLEGNRTKEVRPVDTNMETSGINMDYIFSIDKNPTDG